MQGGRGEGGGEGRIMTTRESAVQFLGQGMSGQGACSCFLMAPSPGLTGGAQTTLQASARPLASSKWMACEAASWASSARICMQERRRGGHRGV